jgi:hypothetical protein
MPAAAKWLMGIVTGGIVLGTFLGAAANPEMKQAPAPWWQLTGREDEIVVSNMQFVEPFPEDLDVFGGYRPNLDYDAVAWALPIPEYELAAYAEELSAPAAEELPRVTYGITEAELAAEQAEAAAEEAEAAEVAEPAPEAPKSELALAGLY